MGACCVRNNCVIKSTGASGRFNANKSRVRSTRSSIYQLNKENILDVYDICNKISSGYYGTVKKACMKNDPSTYYAVKSINKSNLSKKNLKNLICEIQVLAKLDHPNIVRYYETYDDDKYFHLVMELCEGGELFQRIVKRKRLKEKEAAEILYKLSHAISHCHSRGIVHRDIKAENVLFESKSDTTNNVKIIDFGLARKKGDHNLHSIVGTPCYVAPEVLEGTYDRKCDIWALGILTYVMLYGKYPFDDENKSVLFEKIKKHEPKYDTSFVSQEALNIMKEMLQKDSTKRPEAEKLLDHPWFAIHLKDEFKDSIQDLEMIPRLKSFKTPNAFIKKIIRFLVKEIHSPELEDLKNKWYILDEKKNGVVDIAKYQSVIDPTMIHKLQTQPTSKKQDNSVEGSNKVDVDNNNNNNNNNENLFGDCLLNKFVKTDPPPPSMSTHGKIDYTSFMAANCKDKKLITEDMIKQLFNRFDVDNLGHITIQGFHKALRRTGKQITEDETETMLKEGGFDNPDCITYEEFFKVISDFLF